MNILSVWKHTRQSFTTEAQASLPVNLIGEVELTDAHLEVVHGGSGHGSHNYDDNHNTNVLNGTSVLSNNNILNGAVSHIGVLGTGSSDSSNRESSHCHRCY